MADPTTTLAPPSLRSGDGAQVPAGTATSPVVEPSRLAPPPVRPISQPSSPVAGTPARIESKGKVARISDQTKGIVDDAKTWVDLRIALAKQEVRDEVKGRVDGAKAIGQPLVLLIAVVLLAGAFFLLTLSFGFTALYVWGFASLHAGLLLGFLTTTALLGIAAVVFNAQFQKAKAASSADSPKTPA